MGVHPSAHHLVLEDNVMDGIALTLFAFAAFVGGFVSGFSGFAMGLVVSRRLAAHHHAGTNCHPNCQVWPAHAGLWHL
jgi:hypothetical protein